jgi:hypothetical protein
MGTDEMSNIIYASAIFDARRLSNAYERAAVALIRAQAEWLSKTLPADHFRNFSINPQDSNHD